MDAAVAGTMFLITRTWDSFFDPIVGVMCDRTASKWGKFRPYLLWLAIPFGIMGILTFTTPELSAAGKVVYAYITYSLMMMVYSLINVPYASLLGVMSPSPHERTALSSYRMIFAFLGGILTLILIEPLVAGFSRLKAVPDLQFGWTMSMVVFAAIAIAFFLCTFFWTKERVLPIKETKNSLKEDLGDLFRNKPWWILLASGIAALIFNSIRDGAAVYYFKYYAAAADTFDLGVVGSALSLATIYLVLGQAANILGILLCTPVSKRLGKKKTYFGAMLLAAVFSVLFYTAGPQDIVLMLALQVLISACAGSIFPLLWSMYADTADYSEQKTGRRATGLIFSSSSMSQKFGWSIGGALTGWLLAFFGFQANVAQTAGALDGIRMMLSFLPAAGAILSMICVSFYPLSEKKMKEITLSLNLKRK
jgi:GPH family glycoside/pentoside/hexuronide:cation symporter